MFKCQSKPIKLCLVTRTVHEHTCTLNRLEGQLSSQAESMMAWHTARSLNIGSCTATRGYSSP